MKYYSMEIIRTNQNSKQEYDRKLKSFKCLLRKLRALPNLDYSEIKNVNKFRKMKELNNLI